LFVRILVVEDEKKIAMAVRECLVSEGYEVELAFNGEEGFYRLYAETFDLVILDIMLPSRDGLEILRTIRQPGHRVPVLLLTAKDSVEDIVRGLDAGADGYLVKPFAFPELLARIRVFMRLGLAEATPMLACADLVVNAGDRSATRAGKSLDLTLREFKLLEYLLKNKGEIVSREMLARDVWKEASRQTPLDNVIDITVSRLRRKIDDPFDSKLLQTVRGVGFILREPAA
jgi:two-component system, OmpR family, copper resistance phosphate regulon response regulator CusR